ncbi:MAG: NUDIX hydrolase [Acidimicrobiales bacterium]
MLGRLHRLLLRFYGRLPRLARRRIVRVLAPTFTVGAMCFVERGDGAILLVRHSYRRRWGTPGGLLARGEAPADAARREVLEEVGVDIDLMGEPTVVVDAPARRVDVLFRARLAGGVDSDMVRPSSNEIVECRWFPAGELPELQFETAEGLRVITRQTRSLPGDAGHARAIRQRTVAGES